MNNNKAPEIPLRIVYYKNFEQDRLCLKMDVSQLEGLGFYSYIHWAFANITDFFDVDVSDYYEQFDSFKQIDAVKRVISFGGWGFSTSVYTYTILRNSVKEANR